MVLMTNLLNHFIVDDDERGNVDGFEVSEIDEKDDDGVLVQDFATIDPCSIMTIVERGQVDATDLDVVPEIEKFSNLESPDLATTQHDLNLLN